MHELSIAQNLIELAEDAARPAGATQITRVHVQIGRLAGVVKESLLFCFDVATEGTLLAGAELVVEELPVVVYCPTCDQEQTLAQGVRLRCPVCGTSTPRLVQGRELLLRSVEMITADADENPAGLPASQESHHSPMANEERTHATTNS